MSQDAECVRVAREVLGADVVGAYLHGSAVLGGLHPHSDVDVLVVSRRRTTTAQQRALVKKLLDISGDGAAPGSARPVELTLVVQSDIRPWNYPPRCEFQYGEWLREQYERGHTPSPTPSPDLALLITMVRQGDTRLAGPPPEEVLPPVPWDDLAHGAVASVPDLLAELDSDTRNVVLTLARVWSTLATATITSKDAAAEWALNRLPAEHQPVLARARAIYLGNRDERWDDLAPRLRPFADHISDAIRTYAQGR